MEATLMHPHTNKDADGVCMSYTVISKCAPRAARAGDIVMLDTGLELTILLQKCQRERRRSCFRTATVSGLTMTFELTCVAMTV